MIDSRVILVKTVSEMARALAIRRAVFIEEQDVAEDLEIDEHDSDPAINETALHVLALRNDEEAVATGRLLLETDHGYAHIGRLAVMKPYRGQGHGSAVMAALHELARQQGFSGITLAAQLHAIGFYERLGYVARDEVFLDAGIEHRWMDLPLTLT